MSPGRHATPGRPSATTADALKLACVSLGCVAGKHPEKKALKKRLVLGDTLRIVGGVATDKTQQNPTNTDMKPTTAHRIAALVEAINAEDIAQGRPEGVEARTAAPDDMNVRLMPSNGVGVDGDIFVAYIDNHCPCEAFAVLTLEETETTTLIPDRVGQGLPDYSDEDCVTVDGVTFLVVYLGGVAL